MNEFGVDTSYGTLLTQTAVDNLSFSISRITDFTYANSGTAAYYNNTISADTGCYPNVVLVQTTNNKPAGVYFFSHAWNATSAAFEATSCCDWLDSKGINPRLGVFMDFERLAPSGRVGGYENLVYLVGGTPSASLMQSIFSSWCTTVTSRGYKAGLYMNMDPINAVTDSWLQNARFDPALGSPYFWLAQLAPSPSWDCDIWQYAHNQSWQGINVDYNKAQNDRIFSGGGSSIIPLWLKVRIAQGSERNGKYTVLL